MSHLKIAKDTERQGAVGNGRQAIVMGGSIAGLLAARVLTDHFDQVTIVERDRFPEKPEPRQGVPQSHQLHVLLTQGQRILEQLFPGLTDELADNGAESVDWTADYQWLFLGGWGPKFPSGIITRTCTRNLIEALIRQRLATYNSIKFLEAGTVTGLLTNKGNTAVTGVRVRESNGTEVELPAQFVIDASGRYSKTPQWLQSLGYEAPQETMVNSFLGYASRWYQSLSGEPLDYKVLYLMPKAPNKPRGGVIYRVEGDRWIVTLAGVGRDYPPTDEAGFLEFAHTLQSPEVYEAIKDAQPISPIYGYRRTENRLLHYERLSRFPENFVVVGDAACAFNPVYGQGMTVAALGALTLDQCLKQHFQGGSNQELTGLGRHFQKQLAKVNTVPWLMATSDDFRWSTTEGSKPSPITRLLHWYLDQVMLVAGESTEVYKVLIEVIHFLKPPTAFLQPSILAQVLGQVMNRHNKADVAPKSFRTS